MARFIDFLSLVFTTAIFVGAIVGVVVVVRKLSAAVESTKASLRERGWNVSDSGISVKTTKRLNREDYIDATQRGFIKAMGASSFGSQNNSPNGSPNPNAGGKTPKVGGSSSRSGSISGDSIRRKA
ncbi:hypothetical protein FA95DRAFT_1608038 [Auriscalpium vulgare]|uniref:Uncharacterized protein n=1 Tax=Auriscalpium vulgare TaxID=40419 RepID=A0ACB8RMF2_9AGAM|nr:hypothetical protein FA95DRAFT_1608038 [Auriscalpium vulgare]